MNLLNKDFANKQEQLLMNNGTPFAKAKIYQAAKKEAMDRLGILSDQDVLEDELEAKITGVLCGWVVNAYSTKFDIQ